MDFNKVITNMQELQSKIEVYELNRKKCVKYKNINHERNCKKI